MKYEYDINEIQEGVNHCLRKIGNLPDADDVAQDAMLRAWKYRDGFRGDCKPRNWGYRIARNVAMDYISRKKKEQSKVALDDTFNDAASTYYDIVADTNAVDPYDQALNEEAWKLCDVAYNTMSRMWLHNWIDRDLHGKAYSQIASERNLPIGTARSSISRARHKMRPHIEELFSHVEQTQVQNLVRTALELLEARLSRGS